MTLFWSPAGARGGDTLQFGWKKARLGVHNSPALGQEVPQEAAEAVREPGRAAGRGAGHGAGTWGHPERGQRDGRPQGGGGGQRHGNPQELRADMGTCQGWGNMRNSPGRTQGQETWGGVGVGIREPPGGGGDTQGPAGGHGDPLWGTVGHGDPLGGWGGRAGIGTP